MYKPNLMVMTVEKKNGAAKKVGFVAARYESEFRKMTKSQQELIKSALEALFEWSGPEGYTLPPGLVQVVCMREPQIILHWKCWADIGRLWGYRWRFAEIKTGDEKTGMAIHFWHKDTPDEKYEFYLHYRDYEAKIRRWAQMDLEVMVCKTLLKNALSFFAPHIVAREPFSIVASFDEYDLPSEPAAPPAPDDKAFRQRVSEIIKAKGIEPEAVRLLLQQNYNVSRLEELTPTQRAELLELLSA